MRELTRGEKSKIRERAKTFLIVLLLLCCIFFAYNIYEIYGYRLNLTPVGGEGLFGGDTASVNNVTELTDKILQPEMILVNEAGRHRLIESSNDSFSVAADAVSSLISSVNKNGTQITFSEVDEKVWRSFLKAGSLYLKYPVVWSNSIAGELDETRDKAAEAKLGAYEEVLAVPDTGGEETLLLLPNITNGKIIKIAVQGTETDALAEIIKKESTGKNQNVIFAYELNFDKGSAVKNEADVTVPLEPMIVIPTVTEKTADIIVDVPKLYKMSLEDITKLSSFTNGLINVFGYNINTVRQYVSHNGAFIFVGETGSLSIYPQGYIEYKSLDADSGVQLAALEGADLTLYAEINGVKSFIEKILQLSGLSENGAAELRLTNNIKEIKSDTGAESLVIGFDYFVDGKKVKFSEGCAIEAVVDGGMLVEYKMQLRDIVKSGDKTDVQPFFEAMSDFNKKNEGITRIKSGKLVYSFDENGKEATAEWEIQGER